MFLSPNQIWLSLATLQWILILDNNLSLYIFYYLMTNLPEVSSMFNEINCWLHDFLSFWILVVVTLKFMEEIGIMSWKVLKKGNRWHRNRFSIPQWPQEVSCFFLGLRWYFVLIIHLNLWFGFYFGFSIRIFLINRFASYNNLKARRYSLFINFLNNWEYYSWLFSIFNVSTLLEIMVSKTRSRLGTLKQSSTMEFSIAWLHLTLPILAA